MKTTQERIDEIIEKSDKSLLDRAILKLQLELLVISAQLDSFKENK